MIFKQFQNAGTASPLDNLEEGVRDLSSKIIKTVFVDELRREERINKVISIYYQFPDQQIPWVLSKTVNISRSGMCIGINEIVPVGETIEVELGRKTMNAREVFRLTGRVVGISEGKGQQILCHIAFKEKAIKFHQLNNVLWSLADINSWFLEKYTADCSGLDVDDLEELKAAYALVYQEYKSRKLCVENHEEKFYNAYSFVPGSRTFLLRKEEKLLGTLCLVADSSLGLPMETIFPEEVGHMRAEGRKMAEVGALALNSKHVNMKQYSFKNFQKQAYLYKLYKTMFDYARSSEKITDFIIGCHPRHEFLYKYLNFETISPAKSYQGANAAPAVLMRLSIPDAYRHTMLLKEGPGMYFFKEAKYPRTFNLDFTLSKPFVQGLLKNSSFWNNFKPEHQAYIKEMYEI